MKNLLSVAVAAAFGAAAFSAGAADVTLYGRADLGLSYMQEKLDNGGVKADSKSWSMDSGNWTGSRFGLMGNEELGNGLTVGFILENGFDADTGALHTGGKIFDRQATLSLSGAFGTVYAGRMGALISDAGSVGFYAGAVSPFGSGMGAIDGHQAVTVHAATRWDNAVAYVTPNLGGFTGYAQYAMGDTNENTSSTDRYAAVGGMYVNGPLTVAGLVDRLDRRTAGTFQDMPIGDFATLLNKDIKDTWTFNLGGSYDFGPVCVYAAAQYFKDAGNPASALTGALKGFYVRPGQLEEYALLTAAFHDFDGYGVNLGLSAPVAGGTAMFSAGYMDADMKPAALWPDSTDVNTYTVLGGYSYNLSKRTSLYAAAGMTRQVYEVNNAKDKRTIGQVAAGLVHKF